MLVRSIEITNLRSLRELSLVACPALNLIVGPNGSGKTSFLEAIYMLSTSRSFRGMRSLDFIRRGEDQTRVVACIRDDEGVEYRAGVERSRRQVRIRLAGETVRSASLLARRHPVLLITPESQRLFSDGAQARRNLIDWIVFHVEPDYVAAHARFRRALNQRNAALRARHDDRVLTSWNEELGESGKRLAQFRQDCLRAWLPDTRDLLRELVGQTIDMAYDPGWEEGLPLVAALQAGLSRDRQRGFTGRGPQRADLRMTANGTPVRYTLSRGEMKLCVVGLLLTQAMLLKRVTGRVPVLLVDELASDLDRDNRRRILDAILALEAQAFITSVDSYWPELPGGVTRKVFHVEQGRVQDDTISSPETDM